MQLKVQRELSFWLHQGPDGGSNGTVSFLAVIWIKQIEVCIPVYAHTWCFTESGPWGTVVAEKTKCQYRIAFHEVKDDLLFSHHIRLAVDLLLTRKGY
jgi:hypothetical protein